MRLVAKIKTPAQYQDYCDRYDKGEALVNGHSEDETDFVNHFNLLEALWDAIAEWCFVGKNLYEQDHPV